jgi:uncharacterized small protein (DUF1192 family)
MSDEAIKHYSLTNLSERLALVEDEVKGLHDAHKATVAAMNANTSAMNTLNNSIERIERTVEAKLEKLSESHFAHLVDSEREKGTMKYLAVKLWAASAAGLGALAASAWAYREEIYAFIKGH